MKKCCEQGHLASKFHEFKESINITRLVKGCLTISWNTVAVSRSAPIPLIWLFVIPIGSLTREINSTHCFVCTSIMRYWSYQSNLVNCILFMSLIIIFLSLTAEGAEIKLRTRITASLQSKNDILILFLSDNLFLCILLITFSLIIIVTEASRELTGPGIALQTHS